MRIENETKPSEMMTAIIFLLHNTTAESQCEKRSSHMSLKDEDTF